LKSHLSPSLRPRLHCLLLRKANVYLSFSVGVQEEQVTADAVPFLGRMSSLSSGGKYCPHHLGPPWRWRQDVCQSFKKIRQTTARYVGVEWSCEVDRKRPLNKTVPAGTEETKIMLGRRSPHLGLTLSLLNTKQASYIFCSMRCSWIGISERTRWFLLRDQDIWRTEGPRCLKRETSPPSQTLGSSVRVPHEPIFHTSKDSHLFSVCVFSVGGVWRVGRQGCSQLHAHSGTTMQCPTQRRYWMGPTACPVRVGARRISTAVAGYSYSIPGLPGDLALSIVRHSKQQNVSEVPTVYFVRLVVWRDLFCWVCQGELTPITVRNRVERHVPQMQSLTRNASSDLQLSYTSAFRGMELRPIEDIWIEYKLNSAHPFTPYLRSPLLSAHLLLGLPSGLHCWLLRSTFMYFFLASFIRRATGQSGTVSRATHWHSGRVTFHTKTPDWAIHGYTEYLQTESGKMPLNRPRPLPSISFRI
jgi:hypothetical protein